MYLLPYKKHSFPKYGEAIGCAKENAPTIQRSRSLPHPFLQRK